ncbi:uroporphyrinogen-III C-methyltransferase [Marinomonas sp. IMCC 4694]|uniref:uroporphyrinogen-III C-methyltransferase n=1 Tax=Marinomonas sp. IMCC 4694 TaxID=2605432 RepID=UPI0011E7A157|nr:uroporphyrinogen-III C-methyltransferase [Marinomonas sp. IMCC 4694]TYL48633.1 heme biosynthesis protein HemY [Marinomonas sp. IMCC 4694]
MTENNQQEHSESSKESTPVTPSNTSHPKKTLFSPTAGQKIDLSPSKNTLPYAAFGLSAIAIALSGWLYLQSMQSTVDNDISALKNAQSTLSSQLNSNNISATELNRLAEQIQGATQTNQSQNSQLLTRLSLQEEKLLILESKMSRLGNTTKEDWKLAEAEYLIRLANQRLLLESDNVGAATLLINADDILNELKDPLVFSTRKALAKDIQALKSISQFDLEGAYLKLNALYESVETLPQREPSKAWQSTSSEQNTLLQTGSKATNVDASQAVTTMLSSLWESLQSLVVINYNHKPIKALLPPAEYQTLVTGLQLQLDVAQVALIKGEPRIYQQTLSRVATAITEHFETQADSVVFFLGGLTALQQLNPSPELPLPRESLLAMRALMQEWDRRNTDVTTSPEPVVQETTTQEQPQNPSPQDEPKAEQGGGA